MENSNSRWAAGPFKLITETGVKSRPEIPSTSMIYVYAQQIALAHNLFLRGLNASYHQCLGVKSGSVDARDFLIFNQVLSEVIHDHHDMEEDFLFPAIEQISDQHKGLMQSNFEEHAEFQESFNAFRRYVFETNGAP
jgi:hemerythrin-like domain-containing protein